MTNYHLPLNIIIVKIVTTGYIGKLYYEIGSTLYIREKNHRRHIKKQINENTLIVVIHIFYCFAQKSVYSMKCLI